MYTHRDLFRLRGVHPKLVGSVLKLFDTFSMFVVQGVRTVAQQQALYARGRTLPGPIVTYKDGVRHRSNHQPHPDGLGWAVDCAFLGGDPFAPTHPWLAYGVAAEAAGLTWGGRYLHLVDLPHIELT